MFWSCTTTEVDYTLIMDGFNVIPIDKSISSTPTSISTKSSNNGVEIIRDDAVPVAKAKGGGLFLTLSIFILLGVILYFIYLVYSRFAMLNDINFLGDQLNTIGKNIDKNEMEDFRTMDKKLKTINQKLSRHTLNSQIFIFVNNNIRNTLQITEYRLDVKDKEVEVTLAAIAPSFKEFAEQTEKLFQLKESGSIKSFRISNLSFEADTRRLRFTTSLVFDRALVSAITPVGTSTNPNNITN